MSYLSAVLIACLMTVIPDQPGLRKVSLVAKDRPLVDCLIDVCKQANLKFEADEDALREMVEVTRIDLEQKVTADFDNETLSNVIADLVEFHKHPGLFYQFRTNTVLLTTIAAWQKRQQDLFPIWLRDRSNGVHASLNEKGEVQKVYFDDRADEAFLKKLATLNSLKEVEITSSPQNPPGRSTPSTGSSALRRSPGKLTLASLGHLAKCQSLTSVKLYQVGRPANNNVPWSSDDALRQIARIPGLRELDAGNCGVSDDGLRHLRTLVDLQQLYLRQNQITDDGLAHLAGFKKLKSLDLGCHVRDARYGKNEVTDAGIAYIAGLQQLEFLGTEGMNVSATELNFPNLKSLTLGSAFSGLVVDNRALGNLLRYKNLESLTVTSPMVNDAGIALISNINTLTSLKLHCSRVTDAGVATLVSLPLKQLQLRNVTLTDDGLRSISKIKTLSRITLHGGIDKTTVDGFQHLSELPKLHALYLVGRWGSGNITGFGRISQLRELNFMSPDLRKITQKDLDQLGDLLPKASVSIMTGGGSYSPGAKFGMAIPDWSGGINLPTGLPGGLGNSIIFDSNPPRP